MRSRLTRSTRWLRRMETRLYAFVALETGLAVGVLIVSFVDPFDIASSVGWNWPLFTALLAAAIALDRARTELFGASRQTPSFAPTFAAALMLGPAATGVLVATTYVIAQLLEREPWYKLAFNASNISLAHMAASMLFFALTGMPAADQTLEHLPAALAAALLVYVAATIPLSTVVAITTRRSIWSVWVEKYRWLGPHYLAFGVSSYAMSSAYLALGAVGLAIFAVPLVMLWVGVRQYTTRTRADAEELQHANEALARGEERFRSLVQNAPGLTAVFGPDGALQYLSGAREIDRAQDARNFLPLLHPADIDGVRTILDDLLPEPGGERTSQVRLRAHNGEWREFEATFTNLVDASAVGGIVVNARDITERNALETELRYQAFHDPLTQLPNRALFMEKLKTALADAEETKERVAVLFIDLDRFKVINDSLGHHIGDELLVALATRLKELAGPEATVARFGGDEFTVLLDRVPTPRDATDFAARVLETMRDPVKLLGHNAIITASIGISLSAPDRLQPRELIRSADVALFHAKDQGRGRSVLFDQTLDRYSVERLQLESELRQAVEENQLRLHYQPELDLRTGRVVGFEALVRWEHPTRGMIPPGEFISLAEETGEIINIGKWVLQQACTQAAEWQRTLFEGTRFTMAVNLSANEFLESGLVWHVLRTLRDTGLDANTLRVEITESVLLGDSPVTNEIFFELKRLGVELAIDDFGTGYSSLSYLRKLPADVLKIDRSFVAEVDRDEREGAIVRAVVEVADALGMRVTAEGIERPGQLEFLAAIGSDTGQGYYFARPAPPDQIEAYVRKQREGLARAS